MKSRTQFLVDGMVAGGLVGAAVFGVTAWVWLHPSRLVLLVVPLLSGPIVPLLTRLDISDVQLWSIALALLIPYWVMLGACAGWVGHSLSSSAQSSGEQTNGACRGTTWGALSVLVVLGAVLPGPFWPSLVWSGRAPENTIIANLKQIDGAKEVLALEKKLPPGQVVTESDLIPYLGGPFKRFRVGTERYVINPVGMRPYAVLDVDLRIRRRGFAPGYTLPKGRVYRID